MLRLPHTSLSGETTLGTGEEVLGPALGCRNHQGLVASALSLDSLPPPIRGLAAAGYIRAIRMLKIPYNASAVIVADTSQFSPVDRLPLTALYVSKGPDDPEDLIGGRVLDRKWIDSILPAMWEESCTSLHGGLCRSVPAQISAIRPTWLVDVYKQCIIPAADGCSYVALSYVWGDQKTLLALRSNHGLLRQPGSLAQTTWKPPISITMRDAMAIVKLLGERYLWVDSLCIVQDEGPQKQKELSKMSGIFANSLVTIMAVQGENSNSGLRGFRGTSGPRNLRQTVHRLTNGMTVVQFPVEMDHYEVACEDPVWPTRAWTCQEHLCSRRKLIFDGDSLRWECIGAVWREHVEWTTRLDRAHHNSITSCQSMFQAQIPDFEGFTRILADYNSRDFTYPEDALNAFAGISSAIAPAVGGSLISGLPAAWFDLCLLWSPKKSVLRRAAKVLESNYCLPSWSWVGWSGPVKMDVASGSDFLRRSPRTWGWMKSPARVATLVSWEYHETVESPGTPIQPSILRSREEWLGNRVECAAGWTRHDASESPEAEYEYRDADCSPSCFFRHSKHAVFEFWYPIPLAEPGVPGSVVNARYISCKTRRSWLYPAERIWRLSGHAPLFSLRDGGGRWIGALEPLVGIDESGETMTEQSMALELVEIAKGSCRNTTSSRTGLQEIGHPDIPCDSDWYYYYWVMWVEWERGIAHRKGVGRVCKERWEVLGRDEVDLMLG